MLGVNGRILVIALGAASSLSWAQPALAQSTGPTALSANISSGMVGLAAGQTARLNAYHPAPPAPLATGAVCNAQVSFIDDQGTVLKTAPISVIPGKSVAVDLNPATDLTAPASRIQIRAAITFPPPASNPMSGTMFMPIMGCSLVPTLEIFDDATLKTQVLVATFQGSGLGISILSAERAAPQAQ